LATTETLELPAERRPGVIGYTAGVWDLFHAGHLNLLRQASELCDFLIVGVTTDELATEVKGEAPLVSFLERMAILQSIRYVDHVVPQTSMDKSAVWATLTFDVVFVGDALKGTDDWQALEEKMAGHGARVHYLPSTFVRGGELLERGLPDLIADLT
jgi:glycerol-3-phosphate cytidylyltransferase